MNIIYGGSLCFAVGLYFVLQTAFLADLSPVLALALLLAALFLGVALQREKFLLLHNLFLLCFFLLLGVVSGLRVEPSAAQRLQPYFEKEIILQGRLEPLNFKEQNGSISCILQCSQLQVGSKVKSFDGRIRLSLKKEELFGSRQNAAQEIFSRELAVQGTLKRLRDFRNPGSFQGELYNRLHNLGGRLYKARIITLTKQPAQFAQENIFAQGSVWLDWEQWQQSLTIANWRLRQILQQKLGDEHGALLSSMLLGGSNALAEATREIFTANGLSHLLSVSGTHLLLLAGFLSVVFGKIAPTKRKPLVTLCLCLYALLCGLKPPVLRALMMSTVFLYGGSGGRRGSMLCLTALMLLTVKPLWLLDISFQLSFGAAVGLIWLLPACQKLCPKWLPQPLTECIAVTLAAQLATLPLLAVNFHQVSLISLISNLVLTPILEVIALAAILGLAFCVCGKLFAGLALFTTVSDFLSDMCFGSSQFLLAQVLVQGKFLGSLPYSSIVIGSVPLFCVLLYYLGLGIGADVACLQFLKNWERKAFLFCIVAIIFATQIWAQFSLQPLAVYFLDVGQGDCVVLLTPKRQVLVYDTGGLQGLDTGKHIVVPFLRSLGKNKIDMLFLSHYDYDHVGGAAGLLQQIKVQKLVLPQEVLSENNLPLAANIMQTAQSRGTKIIVAEQGKVWQPDETTSLNLLVPAGFEQNNPQALSGNDASTILLLQNIYGSILLTGDLGSDKEALLDIGKITVFKAAHHGSKNSNSAELLQAIQPQIAVISCGADNRYGHPHAEALARLHNVGSKVVRTDVHGCVKIELGEKLRCFAYAQNGWQELQVDN